MANTVLYLVVSGARHGLGGLAPKNVVYSPPQNILIKNREAFVRNFVILVVSAVKIRKQCLQTASSPYPLPGFSPEPHWGSSEPLSYRPPNENFWCQHRVYFCSLSSPQLCSYVCYFNNSCCVCCVFKACF